MIKTQKRIRNGSILAVSLLQGHHPWIRFKWRSAPAPNSLNDGVSFNNNNNDTKIPLTKVSLSDKIKSVNLVKCQIIA